MCLRRSRWKAPRPTYPGFPVEVGGVEQLHAFEREPHARSWLVLRSRKSGQRWCERRAPVKICHPAEGLRGRPLVSHISRKTSGMPLISCTQLWIGQRVRPFIKERRRKSENKRNSTGRGCGAPGNCGVDRAQSAAGKSFRSLSPQRH